MEQRKGIFNDQFGQSPFQKRKERQQMIDAYSSLKGYRITFNFIKMISKLGVDAFPSPNAILSLSEYFPKQQMVAQPQSQFGTSLFNN